VSVMFLKQLKIHLDQLEKELGKTGGNVDQELAQTRQFLSTTKDQKWKAQLIKRISQLEKSRKEGVDRKDVEARHKLVKELHELIKSHPDYNRVRKRRAK
jgi:hypothetical protein